MASYLSQPKQFSTYVPEVNSEVYASILQKHETDYEQGIQRVEANRDAIASLPIYNTAGRELLKQKLDAQTTELNQKQGVDWSDQGIQRLTTKHINAIADDPEIQTYVGDSTQYKRDYQDAKSSKQSTDGADIANQYVWGQGANQWLNGPRGTRYRTQFTQYTDADKVIDDNLKHLHPDSRIVNTVDGGKDVSLWDNKTQTWKGISSDKVREEIQGIVETNPALKSQLAINAKYVYKDINPNDPNDLYGILKVKQHANERDIIHNVQTSSQLNAMSLQMPDSPLRDALCERERLLGIQNAKLGDYDYEGYLKSLQDPNNLDVAKNQLYMQTWMQNKVGLYSYGEDELKYSGESPWKKMQNNIDNYWKKKNYDLKLKDFELNVDKFRYKQHRDAQGDQTLTDQVLIPGSINTTDLGHAEQTVVNTIKQSEVQATQQGIQTLHDLAIQSGAKTVLDQMEYDPNNRTWQFKTPNAGETIANKTTGSNKGYITATDGTVVTPHEMYVTGYKNRNGDFVPSVLEKLKQKAANGDYSIDENGIGLDDRTATLLKRINTKQHFTDLIKANYGTIAKEWNSTPENKSYTRTVDAINTNPIVVGDYAGSGGRFSVTGNDLENHTNLLKQLAALTGAAKTDLYGKNIQEIIGAYSGIKGSFDVATQDINKLLADHGLTKEKFDEMQRSSEVLNFMNKKGELSEKKQDFMNKRLAESNMLYSPTQVQWNTGNKSPDKGITDQQISDRLSTYINTNLGGKEGFGSDKVNTLEKIYKSGDASTSYSYDQATGKYNILVSDAKNGSVTVPVDAKYATGLGLSNLIPAEDEIEQVLNFKQAGRSSTIVPGTTQNFSSALPLGDIGNIEVKLHAIQSPGETWVYIYRKDKRTGKELPPQTIQYGTDNWKKIRKALNSTLQGMGMSDPILRSSSVSESETQSDY